MRTKTAALLLEKKRINSDLEEPPKISQFTAKTEQQRSSPYKQTVARKQTSNNRHISHVNEYMVMSIGRQSKEEQAGQRCNPGLQMQNYRLIEANCRLAAKCTDILQRMQAAVMFAINLIQEYRYEYTANYLYRLLSEICQLKAIPAGTCPNKQSDHGATNPESRVSESRKAKLCMAKTVNCIQIRPQQKTKLNSTLYSQVSPFNGHTMWMKGSGISHHQEDFRGLNSGMHTHQKWQRIDDFPSNKILDCSIMNRSNEEQAVHRRMLLVQCCEIEALLHKQEQSYRREFFDRQPGSRQVQSDPALYLQPA